MSFDRKYLATDAETGGVDGSVHSLLTAYFAVLNEDYVPVGQLYLKMKPDDGNYVVTAGALGVNHIDLIKHEADPETITISEAKTKLYEFLKEHSVGGKTKLIPLGHNVIFDLQCYYHNLIQERTMKQFVAYRVLDTATICQFLQGIGLMPKNMPASLEALATYFGITNPEPHSAKADTITTILVLKKLNELVKSLTYRPVA